MRDGDFENFETGGTSDFGEFHADILVAIIKPGEANFSFHVDLANESYPQPQDARL